MKPMTNRIIIILSFFLFAGYASMAQKTAVANNSKAKTTEMKTYLIEREITGAGKLTGEELKAISQKSCSVLKDMGPKIQWMQSFVTGNKIFCIYKAENEDLIREHAMKGGFPANIITEISSVISPATAN